MFIKYRFWIITALAILLACFHIEAQSVVDISFAKNKIKDARLRHGDILNKYRFEFRLDSKRLSSEAYQIKVSGKKVRIIGGDEKGLLYGGLEVAEQIQLNKKVQNTQGKPFLKKRGIKMNIPLDARTPSYDDSGDAAQKNIIEMWNWNFWQEFLDDMALHRYNVLSLWNPHPFPSMIKLPEYPDIALDDVNVTTLQPLGRENEWGDPQLVTTNVMNNLKTVKKITIDEKIVFWKRVMRLAKQRGIDIYFITWNICPNSVAQPVEPYHKTFGIGLRDEKPGKYGISHQMDNPKTITYYRKAVKTFLLTYPDIKGIGVTAGEYMPPTWKGYNREQWLWETYGQGILDAKAIQSNRTVDFIHRVWYSDMDQIMKYWKQYPDSFEVSFKYAKARVFSSPEPPFAKTHLKAMEPYALKSWWNLRNDDIFVYRWGDADYVRKFFRYFPKEQTAGYYYGSDGYIWGREFISKTPELAGQLEIKKHWYNFMLFGRLGYDNNLDKTFFSKKLAAHYQGTGTADLYKLWQTASKIIPKVNMFHWRDWDHQWSVEACISRPVLGGFRSVIDFIDNPTMDGSDILNPKEYVKIILDNKISGKITPLQVIEELKGYATNALGGVVNLRKNAALPIETKALLDDIEAMAHLGNYYAEKIDGAVALAFYKKNKLRKHKQAAVSHLEKALQHWIAYSNISTKNYKPQMLARTNLLDWKALINEVKQDIRVAKNMK